MPKIFIFRLENVLKFRRIQENEKKSALALVQAEIARQIIRINELNNQESMAKDDLKEMRKGHIDLTQMRLQESYMLGIARKIAQENLQLIKLRQVEVEKRNEFIEARKKVRLLEKLKEKKLDEYKYQTNVEEMKFMDEVATYQRNVS